MKLHRVRLVNYRGVTDSDVSFSDKGVTIVEGPNEVGKTSIAEALALAVELPDSSRSARVRSAKPVNRDEGPEVEIELSSGQYTLSFNKRWLRNPITILSISSPRSESHTGREAHDRLREILAETLDMDLWDALRIEQGIKLTLPPFTMPSMRRALDSAAGGDLASDHEDTLWERIKEEYGKYWTPTGQENRERKSSQRRKEEATEKADDLTQQMKDVERDVARLDRLVAEAIRVSATQDEYEKSELDLEERWNAIERMRNEIDRLNAIYSTAEAEHRLAEGSWARRQDLLETCAESTEALAALEAGAQEAAPELAAAIRRREAAAASLKDAAEALRLADDRRARAAKDRDYLREQIEVAQISERYERYVQSEQSLKEAEDYLESAIVDDDVLERIEKTYLDDLGARAATDSAAASVETTALSDMRMQIAGKDVDLHAKEVHSELVEDEVELVIPGIARLRVSAGSESKGLAERRRITQEAYLRLCNEVGVADMAEARKAAQERTDTQRVKGDAIAAIKRDLRDLTPDILQAKIKDLTERVTSYPDVRPAEPPLPPDLDEATRIASDAEVVVTDCRTRLDACDAAARKSDEQLTKARLNDADHTARTRVADDRKLESENRLAAARNIQADEALRAALVVTQGRLDAALESWEDVKTQLKAADPDSLETLLLNARAAKKRAIQESQANRDSQSELRARLDLHGEKGLQGLYDQALSEWGHVKREHARVEERAEATRLLQETFEKYRRQAHLRYIEPFKERIDQFGRIVFGPTFAAELDQELRVVRRTLEDATLDVEQLSTGAQEQLGVLCRIACATIVSPDDGGVPVMIDDALGWSDPQRLQAMGAAIAAAGKQCQVVVLTCTPGRYSHVGNAKVVSLIP